MQPNASPSHMDFFNGDASTGGILAALAPHDGKALVMEYGGRIIRPGYHLTEVKAGSFVTLDCGGNPDSWRETVLQVEDLAPGGETAFMSVGKFRAILDQVGRRIALDPEARLTFEVGPPGAAMQVFDAGRLEIGDERVTLRLVPRAAICKPRHREALAAPAPACCAAPAARSSCG
ncbi:DUF6428 family protein [Ancylobacter sp. A5.8]|uniref:DUF6428 family protein n=1 Tax=Ancylobacter gelatini TaxID=2919920 RepID=UPI001F4DE885|nr:DUF6428 family protein [Ancylobacter gelatini]MCJ8144020.1 DUF6428 family protein [Ancylobacter gelatini]